MDFLNSLTKILPELNRMIGNEVIYLRLALLITLIGGFVALVYLAKK